MTIVVDVDQDKWAEQQGIERKEVRADVERYVSNSVRQLPAIQDAAPETNR
jgi:hypothetical protein